MAREATLDPDVDFNGSEDPYIQVKYNPLETLEANGDLYMRLINDMSKTIMLLQAEVTRLRNTFEYGIDSYRNDEKGEIINKILELSK